VSVAAQHEVVVAPYDVQATCSVVVVTRSVLVTRGVVVPGSVVMPNAVVMAGRVPPRTVTRSVVSPVSPMPLYDAPRVLRRPVPGVAPRCLGRGGTRGQRGAVRLGGVGRGGARRAQEGGRPGDRGRRDVAVAGHQHVGAGRRGEDGAGDDAGGGEDGPDAYVG
jgi:hypothetical protein